MNDNNVDLLIGTKIRLRRHVLGMSQTDLGNRIGVTFQQVQKYEKGHNKIVASRLLEVANIMDVPISYFFEDLNNTPSQESLKVSEKVLEFNYDDLEDSNGKEAINLVKIYNNIPNKNVRKKLLIFLKTLTEE